MVNQLLLPGHLERIYEKLGVDNRTAAASFSAAGPPLERGEN